jgi:hypothetical protein
MVVMVVVIIYVVTLVLSKIYLLLTDRIQMDRVDLL